MSAICVGEQVAWAFVAAGSVLASVLETARIAMRAFGLDPSASKKQRSRRRSSRAVKVANPATRLRIDPGSVDGRQSATFMCCFVARRSCWNGHDDRVGQVVGDHQCRCGPKHVPGEVDQLAGSRRFAPPSILTDIRYADLVASWAVGPNESCADLR